MTGPLRNWIDKMVARVALVARFGPMTARAYGAVLRVIIAERLWRVPDRRRPDIAPGGCSP
jgi:hypothetical protein